MSTKNVGFFSWQFSQILWLFLSTSKPLFSFLPQIKSSASGITCGNGKKNDKSAYFCASYWFTNFLVYSCLWQQKRKLTGSQCKKNPLIPPSPFFTADHYGLRAWRNDYSTLFYKSVFKILSARCYCETLIRTTQQKEMESQSRRRLMFLHFYVWNNSFCHAKGLKTQL